MNKKSIRQFIVSSGLYRPTMWVRRHVLRRHELRHAETAAAFFAKWLQPGDLVFDVGANIGSAADIFLRCGARVISVEPLPHCVAEIRARFSGNKRLTLVPKAIGAATGTATLYVSNNDFMSSFDPDWCEAWDHTVDVPITTLDELIATFGVPKLLKIDVEGWESKVLAGLSRPVPFIAFEYHAGDKGIAAVEACVALLERLGPVQLNISSSEQWNVSLEQWVDSAPLIEELRRRSAADPNGYGDILVRMETAT